MRYPRFKLRTLVIVLPLLVAVFGYLWRCGQLDASVGSQFDYHIWSLRAFRCEAILEPCRFHVRWIKTWNDPHGTPLGPAALVLSGQTNISVESIRRAIEEAEANPMRMPVVQHPWTGRQFTPSWTCDLVSVEWGQPVVQATVTSAGYWGGLKIRFGYALDWVAAIPGTTAAWWTTWTPPSPDATPPPPPPSD